jgi:hypothetical protein
MLRQSRGRLATAQLPSAVPPQELRQAGFSQQELDERRAATQKQLETLRAAANDGLDK